MPDRGPQRVANFRCPALEPREVALPRPAGQIVPAALQPQAAGVVEANGRIRAVDLLLHDDMPAGDLLEARRGHVLIARLQARVEKVTSARIFADAGHGGAT